MNFAIFVTMGMLAALAGVVSTSRDGSAVASAGSNYELDVIAAVFIGGAAVQGGVGTVIGAVIGGLMMGMLNMGCPSLLCTRPGRWRSRGCAAPGSRLST